MNLRMQKGFGVAVVAHQLAYGLSNKGHEVTLCSTSESKDFEPINYNWFKFPVYGGSQNRLLPLFQIEIDKSIQRIKSQKIFKDFDVVLTCSFPFYGAGKRLSIPEVHFDFGQAPTSGMGIIGKFNYQYLKWREKISQPRSEKILTISRFLTNYLHSRVLSPVVINLGADQLSEGNRRVNRECELDFEDNFKYGLYVGRLDPENQPYKNVLNLVKMSTEIKKRVPEFQLICVGFGSKSTVDWLEKQDIKVFTSINDNLLAQLYQKSHLYLTATLWEGLDLPILEAAWFKKPAVAFNIGAHPELPVACLANDESEWISGAEKLLKDDLLYLNSSKKAWQQVQELGYSWQNCVNQVEMELFDVFNTYV